MNALSEDTQLFAKVNEKYGIYTMKELYDLHKQGQKIKVPTLLDEKGNTGWIEVEDVASFGKQNLKRLTLTSSRLFLEISQDAIIPAYSSELFSGTEKQIILKFKLVNELKVAQNPKHNDTLLLTTRVFLNLPEGDENDRDYGFALGYWLAEGSKIKRKRKNTKHSLATLNGYAKQKGMTLEEYLNYMTNIERVDLSVGQTDFERGYVNIVLKLFKFTKPHKDKRKNAYRLSSSDLNYIRLIKDYTEGHTSHDKHIKNEVYNRSWKFLEGIMDGFLSGDGHFAKKMDLFLVNITANYKLYNDLIFLSKALGYDAHLHNGQFVKSPSSNNYYYHLGLSILKNWHRHTALGFIKSGVKSVKNAREKEAFNLVLKPLYDENDKRSVFNHLFLTAFGLLVSDATKTYSEKKIEETLIQIENCP